MILEKKTLKITLMLDALKLQSSSVTLESVTATGVQIYWQNGTDNKKVHVRAHTNRKNSFKIRKSDYFVQEKGTIKSRMETIICF